MAYTDRGIDQAEYTFCYEKRERPGSLPELVRLPWALVRFGDPGEDRKYVTPLPNVAFAGSTGQSAASNSEIGWIPYRQFYEMMPNLPFPLESSRPAVSGDPEADNAPGVWAVHFFGPI
jgi:hypothetical protein